MEGLLVELCCGSAEDAIRAAEAGAHRVELNSNLFQGGLTPTLGSLLALKKHCGIPAICMVRPREGGFCYTDIEFETMLADAELLIENGADGLAFGVLDADGRVDAGRCEKLAALAQGRPTVFHRAIDVVPDWRGALDALIGLGITRVLTSGRQNSVLAGAETIRQMAGYAAGRIELLPGGDIAPWNADAVLRATGVNQIHLALQKSCRDSSTGHNPDLHYGGALYPPGDRYRVTDADALRGMMERLAGH